MARLAALPPEILWEIIKHVKYNIDLCSLSQTNRRFYSLISEELDRSLREVFQSELKHSNSDILHWAAKNGNVACVRRLLRAGIPPAPPIIRDWHPIVLAAKYGHVDVVRTFLEHGVDPNPPTGFHKLAPFGNPLTAAVKQGHEPVVRLLIEYGVDLEFTRQGHLIQQPLSLATEHRHIALVKLLLEHGCNPLTPDYCTNALIEGTAWKVASRVSLDILRIFLDTGVQPDFAGPGYRYQDSIVAALRRGDMPLVMFLFDQGASFEMPTYPAYDDIFGRVQPRDVLFNMSRAAGRFPEDAAFLLGKIDVDTIIEQENLRAIVCLMLGATSGGCEDLLRRLLEADWVVKYSILHDDQWQGCLVSCLNMAIRQGHIGLVRLFLGYGADPLYTRLFKKRRGPKYQPTFTAPESRSPARMELLLDRGAEPFVEYFQTLLEEAISIDPGSEACVNIVRILVERDILVPKDRDYSDILVKALHGGPTVFQLVLQHMNVELQPGNSYHEQAFAEAVGLGDTVIMEMFLKAGFDPNDPDESSDLTREGFLAVAAKAGKYGEPAVDLLLKYGADLEWRGGEESLPPLLMIREWGTPNEQAQAVKTLLRKGANPFCVCHRGESLLLNAVKDGALPTVKVLLQHFDERNTPFSHVKSMVEEAAGAATDENIAECLWRWYWRRVYPCPGSDIPQ